MAIDMDEVVQVFKAEGPAPTAAGQAWRRSLLDSTSIPIDTQTTGDDPYIDIGRNACALKLLLG